MVKTQHQQIAADDKVKAEEVRWIEAMVKVIDIHIGNANVCENGIAVLWAMASDNGKMMPA